ncbi:MAG TPA: FAD-dependent oxidoreductase [Armatimonadota bacterium]|jgi:hypothetical protein
MATYTLTERTLPCDDTWEVIVVGGGPAGCAAATAAAREGAKTLLLEATGCLGGMGTSGLVPAWTPFSDQQRIIYGGLAERVFTECKAGMPHVEPRALDWVPLDPERLKRIYDVMVTDACAAVLFNTALVAVDTDGAGAVAAIITQNKAGLTAYRAKVYIDCTGDADLATFAGAAFKQGDEQTGELQPATHCFMLSNVDEYGYRQRKDPIPAILASGKYPLIRDGHWCNNLVGPGTVGFNAGHLWDVDNTDPHSVSRALMQGRELAAQFRDALAEFAPQAFANAYLVATGALMGIRETRRVLGDYYLTAEDFFARRHFHDEVCRNAYPVDIHTTKAESATAHTQDWNPLQRFENYGPGESHGIPYRCLTPAGLRNVLVAGRAISCDHVVQASVRVMPVCLVLGEAAGIAAAHATGLPTHDVHTMDTAHVRARMNAEGAYLPEETAVGA